MALSSDAEQVLEMAHHLDASEKLEIAERLIAEVRYSQASLPRYDWDSVEGLAPYPMMGEDAQTWVTRTRREADEQREGQLRGMDVASK